VKFERLLLFAGFILAIVGAIGVAFPDNLILMMWPGGYGSGDITFCN